eukprot:CAMPEP_0175046774 /NCGR_PEP_ID=MMETSP0052_2-20121109/5218_1 /TAXON_ID=51329 ORGANISM="Polytomella parva, Strain SAG 63-3" /NCGR_SAMPLE_ID=MMETSP0052_2 /ASSEMBLY_ACC=CAM_ASM_000194 /LENGTH=1062 /DNA_ID=CAMNT_0016310559 /DNA_START=230 /DNA_END=3416 /DNA_ORIENTATION=-
MVFCPTCQDEVETSTEDISGLTCCVCCGRVFDELAFATDVQFTKGADGEGEVVGQFVGDDGNARAVARYSNGRMYMSGGDSQAISSQRGKSYISIIVEQLRIFPALEIVQRSFGLYQLALQHNFTKGRRVEQVAAACTYVTCRLDEKPFMLIDFSDHLSINVFVLGAVYLQLLRLLRLEEHPTFTRPVDPTIFLKRFVERLGLPPRSDIGKTKDDVYRTAVFLVRCMKREWMQTGRRASGICGAALFVATNMLGFPRTREQIMSVVHIGWCTMEARMRELANTPVAQHPYSKFDALNDSYNQMQMEYLQEVEYRTHTSHAPGLPSASKPALLPSAWNSTSSNGHAPLALPDSQSVAGSAATQASRHDWDGERNGQNSLVPSRNEPSGSSETALTTTSTSFVDKYYSAEQQAILVDSGFGSALSAGGDADAEQACEHVRCFNTEVFANKQCRECYQAYLAVSEGNYSGCRNPPAYIRSQRRDFRLRAVLMAEEAIKGLLAKSSSSATDAVAVSPGGSGEQGKVGEGGVGDEGEKSSRRGVPLPKVPNPPITTGGPIIVSSLAAAAAAAVAKNADGGVQGAKEGVGNTEVVLRDSISNADTGNENASNNLVAPHLTAISSVVKSGKGSGMYKGLENVDLWNLEFERSVAQFLDPSTITTMTKEIGQLLKSKELQPYLDKHHKAPFSVEAARAADAEALAEFEAAEGVTMLTPTPGDGVGSRRTFNARNKKGNTDELNSNKGDVSPGMHTQGYRPGKGEDDDSVAAGPRASEDPEHHPQALVPYTGAYSDEQSSIPYDAPHPEQGMTHDASAPLPSLPALPSSSPSPLLLLQSDPEKLPSDDELDVSMYLATKEEAALKQRLWDEMNRDWIEKQAEKVMLGLHKKTKKRGPNKRNGAVAGADGAAAAALNLLEAKKLSKKVNYSALEKLFDADFAPGTAEGRRRLEGGGEGPGDGDFESTRRGFDDAGSTEQLLLPSSSSSFAAAAAARDSDASPSYAGEREEGAEVGVAEEEGVTISTTTRNGDRRVNAAKVAPSALSKSRVRGEDNSKLHHQGSGGNMRVHFD